MLEFVSIDSLLRLVESTQSSWEMIPVAALL